MKKPFNPYEKRIIEFKEVMKVYDWKVKIYTITKNDVFQSEGVLESIIKQLPQLLKAAANHHKIAFLIVHEGFDGIWSLVNWWTDKEILRTDTYFSSFDQPDNLLQRPKNGSMACVWELPVINHERNAWVEHILINAEKPDFDNYLSDCITGHV